MSELVGTGIREGEVSSGRDVDDIAVQAIGEAILNALDLELPEDNEQIDDIIEDGRNFHVTTTVKISTDNENERETEGN